MSCCPLCGGAMDAGQIWMLRDRCVLGRGDVQACLTRREFEIFQRLYDLRPRVVSQSNMLEWLYQLSDETPEIKIIDVFICKLRKKLKPLGIAVETVWGQGYAIRFGKEVSFREMQEVDVDAAP